jgi:hypothetical protein
MMGISALHPDVHHEDGVGNPASPSSSSPLSLSSSTDSTGDSSRWFGWRTSSSELDDKTGSLPKCEGGPGGWFKGMSRNRTVSESDGGRVKIDVMSWISGTIRPIPVEYTKTRVNRVNSEPMQSRIRRHSSRDVEEAMAGGLNKADIYMPPF